MADERKTLYKNAGLSADEMRRRREEEGVSLRKLRRDEQVNITLDEYSVVDFSLRARCMIMCYGSVVE